MATNALQNLVNSLVKVDPSATSLSKNVPALSVGEVISVVVRQNLSNGNGTLAYRGNLIPAKLPSHLKIGDQLTTQVEQSDELFILRILDLNRPTTAPVALVSQQLETLANRHKAALLSGFKSFAAPEEAMRLIREHLETLGQNSSKQLPLQTAVENADSIIEALRHVLNGSQGKEIKQLAQRIDQFIQNNSPPPLERQNLLIRNELSSLLARADSLSPEQLKQELELIFQKAQNFTEAHVRRFSGTQANLAILDEAVRNFDRSQSPKAILEGMLSRFQHSVHKSTLDPKTAADLRQLVARLDQLGSTLELLGQLNPMMQAMGEPALILFPFLFQGLITTNELKLKSDRFAHDKEKDKDQSEHGESSEGEREPYQRIELTVPLPSLGDVHVDVAMRKEEILLRLTVADSEVAEFLLEQLEHLASKLKAQGFQEIELTSQVGQVQTAAPEWSSVLRARAEVTA